MNDRFHLPLVQLTEPLSRRTVLALASAASLAAACGPSQPPQRVDAGPVGNFLVGTWTLVTMGSVVVARDAAGLYAYTAVCTHENCVINPPDDTGDSTCGCHGSKFDGNGHVTQGPATRALPHYAVTLEGGHVMVDPSMVVADSARTPVPVDDAGVDAGDMDGGAGEGGTSDGGSADADAMPLPGKDVGAVSAFPMGQFTLVTTPVRVIIGNDAGGLWALLGYCTHFAFPLDAPVNGVIACANTPASSHGSTYDTDGHRTQGPAGDNTCSPGTLCDLPNLKVTVLNGRVYVDQNQKVAIGTRTPVA